MKNENSRSDALGRDKRIFSTGCSGAQTLELIHYIYIKAD
jgi:hypothetical protein